MMWTSMTRTTTITTTTMRRNYSKGHIFVAMLAALALWHSFEGLNAQAIKTERMTIREGDSSGGIKSNSIVNTRSNSNSNGGIYFSDIPLNDAEGSAAGSDANDDDLDESASGKGDDDEDSKDNIDKGSGDEPNGSDPNEIDLGSGEEPPLFISSTERPTKKPVTHKTKETITDDPQLPPIDENDVPQRFTPNAITPETSTKWFVPSSTSTIRSNVNEVDNEDDGNRLNNEVSIMGQKQVTQASFFARPGILAAVIGGAVVGLLCAILLVMFIVYRMRKKDEGSYSLDEPKRSTSTNPYARGANKEFYA